MGGRTVRTEPNVTEYIPDQRVRKPLQRSVWQMNRDAPVFLRAAG